MFSLWCSFSNNGVLTSQKDKNKDSAGCVKLYGCFGSYLTRETLRTITIIQVVENEKKHDLSMLIHKNLRSVIVIISFLERYI